jgi:hypothetical protein
MNRDASIAGRLIQYKRPDWAPLEAVIGDELPGWFMWMHEIELADGSHVHAYKHWHTRRYLHLTSDGRAFIYEPSAHYHQVDLADAIVEAFVGWESADPPARDVLAMRSAVASARRLVA